MRRGERGGLSWGGKMLICWQTTSERVHLGSFGENIARASEMHVGKEGYLPAADLACSDVRV